MTQTHGEFWAKTTPDGQPGISVRDHCLNVGCVVEALVALLSPAVQALLTPGAVTLAALHDVGKITIGFQAKCPPWLARPDTPKVSRGEITLTVSDHALVSQVFLQRHLPLVARLWAVAVGAHHGRPKGRNRQTGLEACAEWAETHRRQLAEELAALFGALPVTSPDTRLAPHHSDLWLLAGLITVADWIGSNETWFAPDHGLPLEAARQQARTALAQIGWPGGKLKATDFAAAFATGRSTGFTPNPVQEAVANAAVQTPGIVIVEGPMGCGKTEAALFAAQQLIASGANHGIYFALPTQVTSNRIHQRIGTFLRNTLADEAPLRLAHGNAWLEDDFDLRLRPAFTKVDLGKEDDPRESTREARSWFASAKQALLATYGVGTIDQALQGVVAVKHFFVRRFALAGKVVILDEVHSYDIYTGTLVAALVRELMNLRCSVIILSATLTAERRKELLKEAGITETESPPAYPLVTAGMNGECRHIAPEWKPRPPISLRAAVISEAETLAELIRRAEAGQHVLWIRNTVVEAQPSFREVCNAVREGTVRVGLLHSRFPFHRRAELEDEWLELLGKNRPADGSGTILIATQVVEQSVDIDLDFIVSDLAPTDMLLQRLGRLWRHERPHRAAVEPEFWVRLPELPADADAAALKKSLGRSARVYAPYVLLRTMAVWRQLPVAADVSRLKSSESQSGLTSAATSLENERRSHINLPADIRPLLEATYAEPDENEPAAWRELHEELEKENRKFVLSADSVIRVLGTPSRDDKKEGFLTRREGAPTTPVVLLRSITGGLNGLTVLVALDGSRIEISEHEWRRSHARFLHQWLVRAPRWMIPKNAPRPRWLDLHGTSDAVVAVVRDDGRCLFGDEVSDMQYDPRVGIFAERAPQPTPQTWKDDDDEFDS
ncbi:MAG: CRISPR-associated helicase Cas3' [Verrucomicrobiae bacterium]|nr:CRISPR-associated helicase Cas3' [Verrucomicrobiae bacterium]